MEGPIPYCCLYEMCQRCYNPEVNKEKYYPVILVHGHNFNKDLSAERSLSSLNSIQYELEEEGYINAGTLLIDDRGEVPFGVLGEVNAPLSIKTSYYFDLIKRNDQAIIIQTKTDDIDSYSIRLKEIIDTVKYLTGKEKVIIIAHSMGGLVSERYLQIFGDSDVDNLILIGVPNGGIKGTILSYCEFFGSKQSCNDMNEDSLFINKLTYGKKPNIPTYNVVGIGCNMNGEDGDGIVTKESARVDWTNNYYINGTCEESKFKFLHGDLINVEKYPEYYELIKEFLKG